MFSPKRQYKGFCNLIENHISLFVANLFLFLFGTLKFSVSEHVTFANSARFVEVALHKNDSSCKTNSDTGAEDVELGRSIQNCLLKYLSKYIVLISIFDFETSF